MGGCTFEGLWDGNSLMVLTLAKTYFCGLGICFGIFSSWQETYF